jgi:hypothetical protein
MQIISKSKFEQNLFIYPPLSTFKKGGAKAFLKGGAKAFLKGGAKAFLKVEPNTSLWVIFHILHTLLHNFF